MREHDLAVKVCRSARDKGLNATELLVWMNLLSGADAEGLVSMTQAELVEMTGKTRTSVSNAILSLVNKGLVEQVSRGWFGRTVTQYRV